MNEFPAGVRSQTRRPNIRITALCTVTHGEFSYSIRFKYRENCSAQRHLYFINRKMEENATVAIIFHCQKQKKLMDYHITNVKNKLCKLSLYLF